MKKIFVFHFILANIFMFLLSYMLFYQINLNQNSPMGHFAPQSIKNRDFSKTERLSSAFENYDKVMPPLYPTLLWITDKLNLPIFTLNFLLLYGYSVLLWFYLLKDFAVSYKIIFFLFYFTRLFLKKEVGQLFQENLLVFLSLIIFILLIKYNEKPNINKLISISILTGLACFTRYFAIFWLIPIVLGSIFYYHRNDLKSVVKKTAIFSCLIGSILLPWFFYVKTTTGYFSGMERFNLNQRNYAKAENKIFAESISFSDNIIFSVKTIVIDFTSLTKFASHKEVLYSSIKPNEYIASIILITLMILSLIKMYKHKIAINRILLLSAVFVLSYFVSMIILWTVGNNDPIYSRYLFPSYIYILVVTMFLLKNLLNKSSENIA